MKLKGGTLGNCPINIAAFSPLSQFFGIMQCSDFPNSERKKEFHLGHTEAANRHLYPFSISAQASIQAALN